MSGHSASGRETKPVMSQAGTSREERRERLLQAARSAMEHAYAPYSNFRVGAALLTDSGEIFIGCNVENASYGMTNCAERTAIFSAVAKLGPEVDIQAIAVVNDKGVPCSPCGACRQILWEFCGDVELVLVNLRGKIETYQLKDLFPKPFDVSYL